MLVSQTPQGRTTTYPLPRRFWFAVMAALAWWILTAVGAIADITDQFPRGVLVVAAAGAVGLTVGALHIHAGARRDELIIRIELEAAVTRTAVASALAAFASRVASGVNLPAPVPVAGRSPEQTMYWQVYTDVLKDLGSLGGGDGPTAPIN